MRELSFELEDVTRSITPNEITYEYKGHVVKVIHSHKVNPRTGVKDGRLSPQVNLRFRGATFNPVHFQQLIRWFESARENQHGYKLRIQKKGPFNAVRAIGVKREGETELHIYTDHLADADPAHIITRPEVLLLRHVISNYARDIKNARTV